MNQLFRPWWLLPGIALMGWFVAWPAQAQITPDNTLPTNSSVLPGCTQCLINGGTERGSNLFHSFRDFSIPTGGLAWFNNATQIQTILARVTGASPSHIDGLIRTNGTASLFFINPNGILFGPNAQLQVGGSFLASTANSLLFADGFEFSATNPQAPPLLTVNLPIGLQFGPKPAALMNESQARVAGIPQPVGLAVAPGQTLALVGGDVTLAGGNLTALGGRVEIGSVQGGSVGLVPSGQGFALRYGDSPTGGSIQLTNGAEVNASGTPGGAIQIQGRSLRLADNARIVSFNFGTQAGGAVTINATEFVEINGVGNYAQRLQELASGTLNPFIVRNVIATLSAGSGAAGDVIINTQRLTLQNGAAIASVTGGAGQAGNSTINASELVDLSASPLFNGTFVGSTGRGGSLTINTSRLIARDNAEISTATFGSGKGGNLTVNATDSVELLGAVPIPAPALNGVFVTGIFANGAAPGGGEAGNLTLTTNRLLITDGAQIGADTNNSIAQGGGGNLNIRAFESIMVTGVSPGTGAPSVITSSGVKQGGNIAIATRQLTLDNQGKISVLSPESAGNLSISAHAVLLNNNAALEAASLLGEGGNIQIQAHNVVLRRNSSISTSAGLLGGSGRGGNITINADFLIAATTENSDIRANAFAGSGGRININALGVYGLQSRPVDTPFSDITASSQLGINGTITVTTLDADPNRGLVALPISLVDSAEAVSTACGPGGRLETGGRFVMVGRGGLPSSPEDQSSDRTLVTLSDLVGAVANSQQSLRPLAQTTTVAPNSAPVVEAQGWAIAPDGGVYLVAQAPDSTPHPPWQPSAKCSL